ncbi:MAG TPA: right-handed parallel beta-helix repeat-containing protein, partial [Paludibacter sp.]|nr:right-handed parallel beta-helix repeat-containing protein [Paludibacter sp.]
MKNKIYFLLIFGLFSVLQSQAKNYFVATNGNDTTGTGTIAAPFATIMKAHAYVVAGDTVFVRGGTYVMKESQIYSKVSIWAYINYLDKSGTSATKRICYWAYPGEHPIFDLSNVKPANYRNTVFYTTGSWLHIKGLEVIGVQVTILTHTQSECFRNEGSNNIFENLSMHDGMAIGFYLTKGANNLVKNCDAYRNWDSVSESGVGGNTDGFGFHPAKGGTGNKITGCRAWFNSDDGYDCINASESVVFENCWAFYNGYTSAFVSRGDGNGFKAGGYGQAPVVSALPSPIPAHTVRFCMAYRNKANGIYANHHVQTGNNWYNNTAYRNSTNYNMLSQKI